MLDISKPLDDLIPVLSVLVTMPLLQVLVPVETVICVELILSSRLRNIKL
jgi:hypothetical protein